MNKPNRNLLVLFNQALMSPGALETEVNGLHELLRQTERSDHFVRVHEMIDLNRYKIFRTSFEIKKLLRSRKEKPFVFLNNLN